MPYAIHLSGPSKMWLRDFAAWFEMIGGVDLPLPSDPSLLWTVFKREYERRARSVFIAMSFHNDQTLRDVGLAIKEAIAQFNAGHPNAPLSRYVSMSSVGLVTRFQHECFRISMRAALSLPTSRTNVPMCIAKSVTPNHAGFRLSSLFEQNPRPLAHHRDRKGAGGNRVHFDLAAFRHIAYDNPLHLRDQLKIDLDALFDNYQSPS